MKAGDYGCDRCNNRKSNGRTVKKRSLGERYEKEIMCNGIRMCNAYGRMPV